MKSFFVSLLATLIFASGMMSASIASPTPTERERSIEAIEKLLNKDEFKSAAEIALKQLNAYDDEQSGRDLELYYHALNRLNDLSGPTNLDTIIQEQTKKHGSNPWFLMSVANLYNTASHSFKLIDGQYIRQPNLWNGEYSGEARDRIEALRCLVRAMTIAQDNENLKLLGILRFHTAKFLAGDPDFFHRYGGTAAPIQAYAALGNLSELNELPAYVDRNESQQYRNVATLPVSVNPKTGQREIIFYHASSSWETAQNDGERMRWLLNAAVQANPDLANAVNLFTATWCKTLFSYGNTVSGQNFIYGPGNAGAAGGFNPSELKENQTVVQTDRTNKGNFMLVTLPPDYDFINIASQVTLNHLPSAYLNARDLIANEFLARNQRNAAADIFKKTLVAWTKVADGSWANPELQNVKGELRELIESIEAPNGEFIRDNRTLVAQEPVSVSFEYRNAAQASVTARPVNMKAWVEEHLNVVLKAQKLDKNYYRQYVSGEYNLLYDLLYNKDYSRFLGQEIKGADLTLTPGEQHLNQVAQVPVPTQAPGWYILTVKLNNGYQFHRLITLHDLMLVQRSVPEGNLWFLADAKTGTPVDNAMINLLRYEQNVKKLIRNHITQHTDKEGIIIERLPNPKITYDQIIGIASKGNSYVILGLNGWNSGNRLMPLGQKAEDSYGCFFLESQPVYKPGQTAHFKGVLFKPDFASPGTASCAGKKLTLIIRGPTGDESIFPKRTVTTDSTGGFELDLLIPSNAPLGGYSALLTMEKSSTRLYAPLFRMEEYKKPEFEVKMDTPSKPLRLGQSIPVAVQADYYAGGPVSEGKATITITRTLGANMWSPFWKWEWLYSHASNPYFIPFTQDDPLTVLEKTIPLDKTGKASVEFSTAQDARDFAAHNITYSVSVSVTDASLREIRADGSVIATCSPFNIFTSLNRGYAPTGTPVQADITAATADGVKIKHARGTAILYRVTAVSPENAPSETREQLKELASWKISTNDEGECSLNFRTADSGLHRLNITLTDKENNTVNSTYDFLSFGTGESLPFKANPLTLTPDKKTYLPGDTAKLLISSDYPNARVWTFFRNSWANESRTLVTLNHQTKELECPLTRNDIPNMGITAFTVRNGELCRASTQLLLPPENQILEPAVTSDRKKYEPGEQGTLTIQVKGPDGKPVNNGIVTLAVYDKALEYIARPNVTNMANTIWGRLNNTEYLTLNMALLNGAAQDRGINQPYFTSITRGSSLYNTNRLARSKGAFNGFVTGSIVSSPASPVIMESRGMMMAKMEVDASSSQKGQQETENSPPQIVLRTKFADSIKWCGTLKTDEQGRVSVPVDMPDNLTTWKASAWVITSSLQAGQASAEFLTTKDFMVSIQAPRFFVEKDVVMLSAIVRNQTDKPVKSRVSLSLKNDCLKLLPDQDSALKGISDAVTNSAIREVTVPAKGQVCVNWWTAAVKEGTAVIAMEATAGKKGDAMEMNYPVLVHGMKQLHTGSAVILPAEQEQQLSISLPQQRRREESDLILKVSPSIALSMVEALPYLAEYPYGCVEQTLNRFLPAMVVTDTLEQLGLKPGKALENQRNLNPQSIEDQALYKRLMQRLERNPVYDESTLKKMAQTGIRELEEKQRSDGSWGWFGGAREGDPVMTAHVLHGLNLIKNAVKIPSNMLTQPAQWLTSYEQSQIRLLAKGDEYRKLSKLPDGEKKREAIRKLGDYRLEVSPSDVLIRSVLAETGVKNLRMEDYLVRDKLTLPIISRIQLAGILLDSHRMAEFKAIMPIISQFLKQDDTLQTAWLHLPNDGYWWRWYGSNTATQAAYLKLMAKSDPTNPVTARLAKWLLNNRANGSYWDSTKDTADCLEALSVYLFQTREGMEDMEAEIYYDGALVKTISSTKDTLFTFDNEFHMQGRALTDGKHVITIKRKKGTGNIYANSTLSYFSLEDPIPAAGNAVTVARAYYRINKQTMKNPAVKDTQTDTGELIVQGTDVTSRTLLKDGDIISSGDIIEVIMSVKTKNDVEYLMLRDPKPAGCESQDVTSGYAALGGTWGYKEIGNEEIRIFLSTLSMGEYQISHRLRAERPGRFSALPSIIEAMYAPELRGNSAEHKINIAQPKQ